MSPDAEMKASREPAVLSSGPLVGGALSDILLPETSPSALLLPTIPASRILWARSRRGSRLLRLRMLDVGGVVVCRIMFRHRGEMCAVEFVGMASGGRVFQRLRGGGLGGIGRRRFFRRLGR